MWLFLLLVVGLVTVRRLATLTWWLVTAGVFAVLMVMAAAYEGGLVALLTGLSWNDRFRFTAMAVLGMAVLSAHGLVVVADWLAAAVLAGASWRSPAGTRRAAALVMVVLAFAASRKGSTPGTTATACRPSSTMGSGDRSCLRNWWPWQSWPSWSGRGRP